MKFELSFNEDRAENEDTIQRMTAACGVMVGLDVMYYAFVSNSIGIHFEQVTKTRMSIGLFIKWVLLAFMVSINVADGMFDAFVWGALIGFVVYTIVNAFTQAVVPGLGGSYPFTNVLYGTIASGMASVAAFYIVK